MRVFSRACSSGRTLQPSPSSTKYQQRLRDKSIKHPPPGKAAKGSSSKQVLENSRCSDSDTQAPDEDPKPQVLHRPAASECPPAPPRRRVPGPRRGTPHPSRLHPRPLRWQGGPPGEDQRDLWLHSPLMGKGTLPAPGPGQPGSAGASPQGRSAPAKPPQEKPGAL